MYHSQLNVVCCDRDCYSINQSGVSSYVIGQPEYEAQDYNANGIDDSHTNESMSTCLIGIDAIAVKQLRDELTKVVFISYIRK